MALVIGVDSSTQSVKVEVRDASTGVVVGIGRGSHPATTPPRSEQDPQTWLSAMVSAFRQALAGVEPSQHDRAVVSVAGQQHGMVAVDDHGAVLRPAKLWNDTESAPQADALVEALDPAGWAAACGSVPVAAFTVTKLAWLKANEPQHFRQLGGVLLPHDWLTAQITGRAVTDRGDASGTGYWSPAEGRWRTDLLRLVDEGTDWSALLPLVLSPFEAAGPLTAAAAEELGLVGMDVTVAPGTGDNMAAALGIGLRPGDVAISLGTSGTVYSVSDRPTADPSGAVAGFADASGHFLPLVCTLNATKVTDAVARLMGVGHQELGELALSAPAGAGGVVLLPYLDGERTPNRPGATGVLAGLRSDVSREQLARAAFEGVACGLLDGLDALHAAGVRTDGRLFLLGGGSRSAAFRHVFAGLTGRPVIVPSEDEHVAAGACVQAGVLLARAAGDASAGPAELAARWGLGGGTTVEPSAMDAAAVRGAYAHVRG